MSNRELTEKQQATLDHLFDQDVKGNLRKAMQKAGYAEGTSTAYLLHTLHEEIVEATERFMSSYTGEAAWALGDILENPTEPGSKEKLTAAGQILDRIGLSRKDRLKAEVEVTGGPIFFLPEKDEVSD